MRIIGPNNDNGTSELEQFQMFLNDPNTSIPISSNFIVRFSQFPAALTETDYLNQLEPNNNWKTPAILDQITTQELANNCLFATGVTLPGESLDVDRPGVLGDSNSWGGLISGVVSKNRKEWPPLTISFLETNASFYDFVIRPWVILTSFLGLNARSADSIENIKTDISVVFFDKTNGNNIRKCFKFYGCAPISLNDSPQYTWEAGKAKFFGANFVYNTYSVNDVED